MKPLMSVLTALLLAGCVGVATVEKGPSPDFNRDMKKQFEIQGCTGDEVDTTYQRQEITIPIEDWLKENLHLLTKNRACVQFGRSAQNQAEPNINRKRIAWFSERIESPHANYPFISISSVSGNAIVVGIEFDWMGNPIRAVSDHQRTEAKMSSVETDSFVKGVFHTLQTAGAIYLGTLPIAKAVKDVSSSLDDGVAELDEMNERAEGIENSIQKGVDAVNGFIDDAEIPGGISVDLE